MTGKSMGSQKVGHDWATELNWSDPDKGTKERWLCLDWPDLLVTGAWWDCSFLAWVPRAGSPHFHLLNIWEDVKSVLVKLLLNSYNNIGNNIYHFNIDKGLQTTKGATERNVLKQPGTRKQSFLESNTGQKPVSPGSLKYITWLRDAAKNPDLRKKKIKQEESGEEKPEFLSRTKGIY